MRRFCIAMLLVCSFGVIATAAVTVNVTTDPSTVCVNQTCYVVVSVSWGTGDPESTGTLATGYVNSNGVALKPMAVREGSSSFVGVYIVTPAELGVLTVDARGVQANTELEHVHFDIVNCP